MAIDFPERVLFEDDRPLQAADLEEEYLYHLQRRWQHNLALHSWGILCGLEVVCTEHKPQQPLLEVRPGMALDGFGREIVLTVQRNALAEQLLDPSQSYDVWIRYHTVSSGEETEDSDCVAQDYPLQRWRDEPLVVVLPTADRQSEKVTKPKEVRPADLAFAPHQPMKFDSAVAWPVFLGRIERQRDRWILDNSERHYGGLKAQRIVNPYDSSTDSTTADSDSVAERNTSILNGPQSNDADMRFAVVAPRAQVGKPTGAPATRSDDTGDVRQQSSEFMPLSIKYVAPPKGEGEPSKTPHHEIVFAGQRLLAKQDVTLADGARIVFAPAATLDNRETAEVPKSIHRELRREETTVAFQDVLQFEMPAATETRESRISFGTVDSSGKYSPVLEVLPASVKVYGTLRVQGTIAGVTSDAPINPNEFREATLDQLRVILTNGATQVRQDLAQAAFETTSDSEIGAAFDKVPTKQKAIASGLLSILLIDQQNNNAHEAIAESLMKNLKQVPTVLAAVISKVATGKVVDAIKAYSERKKIYGQIGDDLIDQLGSDDQERKDLAKSFLDSTHLKSIIADMLKSADSAKLVEALLASASTTQQTSIVNSLLSAQESLVEIVTEKVAWIRRIWKNRGKELGAALNSANIDLGGFVEGVDIPVAKDLMLKLKEKIDAAGGGGADGEEEDH